MHLYSDDMAVIRQRSYGNMEMRCTHTELVCEVKKTWFVDFHVAEHFLPHNAMDSIRSNNDVSDICGSILTLYCGGFMIVINPRNFFVRKQPTLVFDVVVKCSKKEVAVTEHGRVAEPCQRSEGARRKRTCTHVCA